MLAGDANDAFTRQIAAFIEDVSPGGASPAGHTARGALKCPCS
jgi:hypothetical protein